MIGRLPEECVSHVLSLTSPRDACRSAAVSVAFRRAAGSDIVWSRFLPSDYGGILSRAVDPVAYASLKELYFVFCGSILIDGGRKVILGDCLVYLQIGTGTFCYCCYCFYEILQVFGLERERGAKWYTICARDLGIAWGDDPRYWKWVSRPDSRFNLLCCP